MKKAVQILAIVLVILIPVILTAQPFPPEPYSNGQGVNPVGGGAPIGGGLLILLSLAIGYGSKKIYDIRKKVLD
jgi:hypothetical protein